jgi:predicted Zn-dependent peptidase
VPLPEVNRVFVNKAFPKDHATVRLLFPCSKVASVKEHLSLDFLMKIMEYIVYRRLREKEGGVYDYLSGVQKVDAEFVADRYVASLRFDCQPEAVGRLIEAAAEEISNLKKEGPEEKDLQAARAYFKDFINDARWLSYLTELYRQTEPPILISDLGEVIDALSLQDIQQSAQRSFLENCFLRCIEVPEGFKVGGM